MKAWRRHLLKLITASFISTTMLGTGFNGFVKADGSESLTVLPSIDTYVNSEDPDECFSQSTALEVGKGRETYMQFDLRDIDATIVKAELGLSSSWTESWVGIHTVLDDSWTEEITYNTKPAYEESAEGSAFISRSGSVSDITNIIKEAELGDGIASIAITGNSTARPVIASTRSEDEASRPYLKLTLTTDEDEGAIADTKYMLLRDVDKDNVTENLELPTEGVNGTSISWSSSNEAYLTADGTVIRPPWFMGDQNITLTATLSRGASVETSEYNIILPATERTVYTDLPDSGEIVFGDSSSETAQDMEELWTEKMTGAYGESGRKIMPNGGMVITLKCDPEEQNYFTAKFYGEKLDNEGSGGFILLDENGQNLSEYNNETFLMFNTGAPFENRFVFSTYIIPKELTEGKEHVTLILKGNGNIETRCIYSAYCHTETFPDIDISSMPGEAEPLASPPEYEDIRSQYTEKEWLKKQANEAVRLFMGDQIFESDGTNLKKGILEGLIPKCLVGCVPKNWNWNYEIFIKNNNFTYDTILSTVYPRTLRQNMTQLNAAEIFALAYCGDWFEFESDQEREEMLERVLAMLDFCCMAQGANGGYDDNRAKTWIGGPDRANAYAVLEGFGQQSLGRAFELIYNDAEEKGLLDVLIDDDNDDVLIKSESGNYEDNYFAEGETPRIPRREAYERMFKMGRDYLTTDGAGHAPNQDLADIVAALHQDNALKLLGSEEAWSDDERLFYCRRAVGEENNLYTQSRWMSPKGTILEANGSWQGSYSGDYGALAIRDVGRIAEIAAEMGHDEFGVYAERAWDTIGNFMSVGNSETGTPYTGTEGVITWRNTAYPRIGRCVIDAYSAITLKSPMAMRTVQYYFDLNQVYSINIEESYQQAHGSDAALDAIMMLVNYDGLYEAAEESREQNYRYNGETDEDFFFSDEVARTVAFRNNGELMYMSLQWRHLGGQTNELARVHFTTLHTDHIASIRIENPEGLDGYYIAKYKNYLVVMNSSDKNYTGLDLSQYFTVSEDQKVKELSGTLSDPDIRNVDLSPQTTLVFTVSEKYPFEIGDGTVTKTGEYNNDALLVKAIYDDGILTEIQTENIPSSLGIGENMNFDTGTEGDTKKYFVFSNFNNMEPLAKAYSIEKEVNE